MERVLSAKIYRDQQGFIHLDRLVERGRITRQDVLAAIQAADVLL